MISCRGGPCGLPLAPPGQKRGATPEFQGESPVCEGACRLRATGRPKGRPYTGFVESRIVTLPRAIMGSGG